MGARFSLLILISTTSLSVYAEQTYETERDRLYENALLNGKFKDEALISSLFDKDFLLIDMCEMMGDTFKNEEIKCDLEPEFLIEGMSIEGREALISASEAYGSYQLDLFDEEARLFVSFCETGVNDPSNIASEISQIRGSIFVLELQFYERVIGELDETDVHLLERHNLEAYGAARPEANHASQEIEEELAKRFPQEYRRAHLQKCITAVENKGLPYKRFRREPFREDCENTTRSFGANGETIVSTAVPFVDGCVTIEYFAQKPEKPGDTEVTYE